MVQLASMDPQTPAASTTFRIWQVFPIAYVGPCVPSCRKAITTAKTCKKAIHHHPRLRLHCTQDASNTVDSFSPSPDISDSPPLPPLIYIPLAPAKPSTISLATHHQSFKDDLQVTQDLPLLLLHVRRPKHVRGQVILRPFPHSTKPYLPPSFSFYSHHRHSSPNCPVHGLGTSTRAGSRTCQDLRPPHDGCEEVARGGYTPEAFGQACT